MAKCICGLDHSKPIPDSFDGYSSDADYFYSPVVYGYIGLHFLAFCHVCGGTSAVKGYDDSIHLKGCKYLKWKETYEQTKDNSRKEKSERTKDNPSKSE